MPEILLEREQIAVFERLVEAYRSKPRPERQPFMAIRTMGADIVQGNGINTDQILWDDLMTLADQGLIRADWMTNGGGINFTIPPFGLKVYEQLHKQAAEPAAEVENHIVRYLDADEFRSIYPSAYARWREASHLVWSSDSERELSTIGHICRETMQMFLTELIEKNGIADANPDVAMTRDRFSAIVANRREAIGSARTVFLDALFDYWRALGDLVQRQEHAGQREAEPLTWEDGRRVVFQTAVVMFEVARSL